jgi:hypothetical protein
MQLNDDVVIGALNKTRVIATDREAANREPGVIKALRGAAHFGVFARYC